MCWVSGGKGSISYPDMLQDKLGVYSFLGIEILVLEEFIKGLRGWIQFFLRVIVIQVNRTKSGGHNTASIKATCLNSEDPKNPSPITENCHIPDLLYECRRHTWIKMVCPLPTCTIHLIWPRNSVVHLSFKLAENSRHNSANSGRKHHTTYHMKSTEKSCSMLFLRENFSLISALC